MIRRVLYLAAHGGFQDQAVPLGGGAAIAEQLIEEWARTQPFDVELVSPSILGPAAPSARDLVAFQERDYARFCHVFSAKTTQKALLERPSEAAILANDLAEGPDFHRLREAGFHIVTIWHVDVVAYIAAIYLRGRARPATLARWWERLRGPFGPLLPPILKLIFDQQRASLLYSSKVVVPSSGMRDVILECYPRTPPERIEVLPWGAREPCFDDARIEDEARRLRALHGVPPEARILLCLSRISPEKGQDILLRALLDWERAGGLPAEPLWLFVCGAPAYMHGRRFEERLRRLAARLRQVKVVFAGQVTGIEKQGCLRLADLYVFPSRHESYGLTLAEALAAGLPCLALDHQGAREMVRPEFGSIVAAPALRAELASLLSNPERLRAMGEQARAWARAHPFTWSAARLAWLLLAR